MKPAILLPATAPNLYSAARLYAAMGFSVLPCNGKRPALTNWKHLQFRRATTRTIDLWQNSGLLQNIGIICGAVSQNLVVIDLDGRDAIRLFSERYPDLMTSYSVASGSGQGLHLYFYVRSLPTTTRVTGGVGFGNIELRADGCYVVAPPSIHPSGKRYRVAGEASEIAALSDLNDVVAWIKRLIREKHGGTMPPAANGGAVHHVTAYGAAALRGEAAKVRLAAPGSRNSVLYEAALRLGSLISDGKIDRATVEARLFEAAAELSASDGETATRRTIDSGINTGLENSRERYRNKA